MSIYIICGHDEQDRDFALELKKSFASAGFEIVDPLTSIEAASNVRGTLRSSLELCDAVMIVLSENALQSRWVIEKVLPPPWFVYSVRTWAQF